MTRFLAPDGCRLAYESAGADAGITVLWQHGLGATAAQPVEVFPALAGVRRLTLECRGHGGSALGDPDRLSIAQFTEDARALLDHLGVERAVVGGISLGAAIALRLAALHPARVRGLILARPAWVDAPAPDTMAVYAEVAELLRRHGAEEGARRFAASPRLASIQSVSPDNAASLRGFFARATPHGTVELLSRIPLDGPGVDRDALRLITVPTLILGCDRDAVHPLGYARALQALIPHATLREITSKSVDRHAYVAEFRAAIASFLAA